MESGRSELLGQVWLCMESGFGMISLQEYRDRYLSLLAKESECISQAGMEDVCMVIIGCVQPDRWKIASTNPNGVH